MIDAPAGALAVALGLQFRLQQTERIPLSNRQQLEIQARDKLIRHALQSVPYYRDHPLIKAMGQHIRWADFPILSREQLQANSDSLISQAPPAEHGRHYEFRSSGSTGRPVKSISSDYAQLFWRALTVRDHQWSRRDLSGHMAMIKYHGPDEHRYPGSRQSNWGQATHMLGYSGQMSTLNSREPLERQYQWLCEIQPDYLLTYPSNLQELARLHLKLAKPLKLRGVSTLGENMTPELRQLVHNAFGCRLTDMYSSQEVGYMALQCPKHDHYHVMSENCLLEVLDEQNQPCHPGETGRVVVTTLQNYVMPLIRYEIGDYAVAGSGCDCGITLPVIERIIGRTRNLMTYPDGRRSWPSYNPMALMDLLPDGRYQLEQTAADSLVLHVMTAVDISTTLEQQIREIIQQAAGYPFRISICKEEDLPRSASGKYEEFISRI
jgi:phenylacetate-CoA ligase